MRYRKLLIAAVLLLLLLLLGRNTLAQGEEIDVNEALAQATAEVAKLKQMNSDQGKTVYTLSEKNKKLQKKYKKLRAYASMRNDQAYAWHQKYLLLAKPPLPRVKAVGREIIGKRFGYDQWPAAEKLIERESGWNPNARNRSSGACGLPQALPCSKMRDKSVSGQIKWFCDYVASRYGTPSAALAHSYSRGWY